MKETTRGIAYVSAHQELLFLDGDEDETNCEHLRQNFISEEGCLVHCFTVECEDPVWLCLLDMIESGSKQDALGILIEKGRML